MAELIGASYDRRAVFPYYEPENLQRFSVDTETEVGLPRLALTWPAQGV
jgi:hypothetical protein